MIPAMTNSVKDKDGQAYNSECHATRDMDIGELNNSYEDSEVADTIMFIGMNCYETQTNYFLNHALLNLQGETKGKRKQWFPKESIEDSRFIFVDPRRTNTQAICEQNDKDRVLHLQIEPGTDTALFNGLLSYVVEQGWHNKKFIAEHTSGFDAALKANKMSLTDCSKATGVSQADLKKALSGVMTITKSSPHWLIWYWQHKMWVGAAHVFVVLADIRKAMHVLPTLALVLHPILTRKSSMAMEKC